MLTNLSNASDPVYGYRFATGAEVSQLFTDAGITNPCGPGCVDRSAIQNLLTLLHPTFSPPNYEFIQGYTGDAPNSVYEDYALLQLRRSGVCERR